MEKHIYGGSDSPETLLNLPKFPNAVLFNDDIIHYDQSGRLRYLFYPALAIWTTVYNCRSCSKDTLSLSKYHHISDSASRDIGSNS